MNNMRKHEVLSDSWKKRVFCLNGLWKTQLYVLSTVCTATRSPEQYIHYEYVVSADAHFFLCICAFLFLANVMVDRGVHCRVSLNSGDPNSSQGMLSTGYLALSVFIWALMKWGCVVSWLSVNWLKKSQVRMHAYDWQQCAVPQWTVKRQPIGDWCFRRCCASQICTVM